MIPSKIVQEIQRSIPYLIDSYGGIRNFITYAREVVDIPLNSSRKSISSAKYNNLIEYFYNLLKLRKDIILLSPWSFYIDLRELNFNTLEPNSINPNEPYSVYDTKGNLKYTVKTHYGAFGGSPLDKNLINNSINGSQYYLKYTTYEGTEKVRLILINLFSKEVRVSNQFFESPRSVETSSITIGNNAPSTISIYTLEAPPTISYTISDFQNIDNLTQVATGGVFNYNITKGTWILLETSDIINRVRITDPSNDLLTVVESGAGYTLYYVGFNIDVKTLNKLFNTTLTYSNRVLNEVITIEP